MARSMLPAILALAALAACAGTRRAGTGPRLAATRPPLPSRKRLAEIHARADADRKGAVAVREEAVRRRAVGDLACAGERISVELEPQSDSLRPLPVISRYCASGCDKDANYLVQVNGTGTAAEASRVGGVGDRGSCPRSALVAYIPPPREPPPVPLEELGARATAEEAIRVRAAAALKCESDLLLVPQMDPARPFPRGVEYFVHGCGRCARYFVVANEERTSAEASILGEVSPRCERLTRNRPDAAPVSTADLQARGIAAALVRGRAEADLACADVDVLPPLWPVPLSASFYAFGCGRCATYRVRSREDGASADVQRIGHVVSRCEGDAIELP